MPWVVTAVTAVAGMISAGLAAGGLTAFAIRLGGSLLLSFAAAALMKPKMQSTAMTGRNITARNPVAAREIVYGTVRKGGVITFMQAGRAVAATRLYANQATKLPDGRTLVWTPGVGISEISVTSMGLLVPIGGPDAPAPSMTVSGYTVEDHSADGYLLLQPVAGALIDTKFFYVNIALASHQVQSIGAIYFDGEMAVAANGTIQPRWAGVLRVEKALGAPDQSAFPQLRADSPGTWTENHRMRGVAAISLRLTFSTNAYPNGLPNVTADVTGKNDVLDPRTGLRGWTDNAALCAADYMSLPTIWSIGAQIGAADGIDEDELIEAANVCDEVVPLAVGGTEKRYTANGVLSLSNGPKANILTMLGAMAGSAPFQAGRWSIRAGAWRAPTISALTMDDARGAVTVTTRVSRSEQFNAVRGTFISPANDWQPDDFPAVVSDVYLAEDKGDRKFLDVELPMTTSATMAQRLAKILLESARRQITVNLPGKLSAWRVGAGEVVPLTMARRGWVAKPFEVRSISTTIEDADGVPLLVPDLVLRETSPQVYDWSATEEQIYAAAPRTALPSAFDIAAPGVPDVTESLYVTRDGTGVKAAVRLEWVASASPYVAQYVIEARLAGGEWREIGRTANTSLDAQDWTPGQWEFRVAALSTLGVASDWAVQAQEVFGLSAPPAALADVTLQTAGGLAILKWARSGDADVRIGGNIVIRHSTDPAPTWQSSYSMDRVAGDQSLAVIPLKPGSYLLRAEDSSGQVGPVTVVATGGAQAVAFASVTVAQADPAFAGTFAGAAVIDGYLTLPGGTMWDDMGMVDAITNIDYAGGVVPSGMFTFGSGFDLGTVRNIRLRSEIGMAAFQAFAMWDDRTGEIDGWGDIDGVDGAEVDVVMEYRETDDDPAGAPVWSDWSRVDSSEIRARAVQARAILSTNDAAFTVRVDRLRLYADEVI